MLITDTEEKLTRLVRVFEGCATGERYIVWLKARRCGAQLLVGLGDNLTYIYIYMHTL